MVAQEELDRDQSSAEDATVRREDSDSEQKQEERDMIERRHRLQDEFLSRSEDMHSFNHDVDWEQGNNPHLKTSKKLTVDPRVTGNPEHLKDVDGNGTDHLNRATQAGFGDARDSRIMNSIDEVLVSPVAAEGKGTLRQPKKPMSNGAKQKPGSDGTRSYQSEPAIDSDGENGNHNPVQLPADTFHEMATAASSDPRHIFIDKNCMKDPVNDAFYLDTWLALAEKNTMIFRCVFRCMPDSEVKSWKEYKEYAAYGERFEEMQTQHNNNTTVTRVSPAKQPDVPPTVHEDDKEKVSGQTPDEKAAGQAAEVNRVEGDVLAAERTADPEAVGLSPIEEKPSTSQDAGSGDLDEGTNHDNAVDYSEAVNLNARTQSWRRRRRATHGAKELHYADEVMDLEHAEQILNQVQGHLVLWPYEWLVSGFRDMVSSMLLTNPKQAGKRGARWKLAVRARPNIAAGNIVSFAFTLIVIITVLTMHISN